MTGLIVLGILAFVVFLVAARSIRIIPQSRVAIVQRLGRYHRTAESGLTFVVPAADVRIEDDWFVLGMRGTGSKTVVIDQAFVPERRSLTLKGSYGARMRTDVPELIKLVARGQVGISKLVTRRYGLDDVGEAYAALDRGEVTGRAIVVMG